MLDAVKNPGASAWLSSHVAKIAENRASEIPIIGSDHAEPLLDGLFLWDMWSIQLIDGQTALFDGWTVWMILAAPKQADPAARHKDAQIRLMMQKDDVWVDQGALFAPGFCLGKREWAGSAYYAPETETLEVFWTAAGRREDEVATFEQRLFKASCKFTVDGSDCTMTDWTPPREFVVNDGSFYALAQQSDGEPGKILGFRDPAFFRDPADGEMYVVFTGSQPGSVHTHSGIIGLAKRTGPSSDEWTLLPPVISADGVNNELERPHVIFRDGLYYLFWSTQRHVFASAETSGPSGLYGMVARNIAGPYEPLNGSGLVACNPEAEPTQAFSWWVSGDLEVSSFVDYWGMEGLTLADSPELITSNFGGTPAPVFSISIDGNTTQVLPR